MGQVGFQNGRSAWLVCLCQFHFEKDQTFAFLIAETITLMAVEKPVTSWGNPQFRLSHHTWKLLALGFGYYFVSDTSPSRGLGKPSVETTASCPWNSSSRLCKSVWSDLPLSSELELAIYFNNHLLKTTWTEKTSDFETVRFLCGSTLSGFLTLTSWQFWNWDVDEFLQRCRFLLNILLCHTYSYQPLIDSWLKNCKSSLKISKQGKGKLPKSTTTPHPKGNLVTLLQCLFHHLEIFYWIWDTFTNIIMFIFVLIQNYLDARLPCASEKSNLHIFCKCWAIHIVACNCSNIVRICHSP